MAPGERFELSIPCENALYGILFPGARPTRLGDPGINYSPDWFLKYLTLERL